jgi:hypothetical protein
MALRVELGNHTVEQRKTFLPLSQMGEDDAYLRTFDAIDNETAAERGAYILQSDGDWHPVANSTEAEKAATILPFRAYLLPSSHHANDRISMMLEDVTGIDTIETIDNDGTHRYYDLNGRELPGKPEKGIYIHNGKKFITH